MSTETRAPRSTPAGPATANPPQGLWGEGTLAEREELLREAERLASVGSWAWDMRSGRVAWSDEMYRLLGLEPGAHPATFEGFIAAVHPDDRAAVQALAARAAAGDVAERADYRIVRPDGAVRDVVGLAQIFRDESGAPRRMVGTAMDVTERRELESQLLQAQKLEAVGRLAGGVAHDFNNLLTAMLCSLSIARRRHGALDELRPIEEAALQASALTKQLLSFSRKSQRDVRVLDLRVTVREALELAGRILGEEVRTSFEPGAQPATVLADERQMHQVILNLAINARDAMPKGGSLSVSISLVDVGNAPSRRFVRLSLRDTGTGMDAATRRRLCEPFFTTKADGLGTGLGLSTVADVVSRSGGSVEVESEVGAGSTFHVFLPFAERTARPRTPPVASAAPGAGQVLLVIEDEPAVRRVVSTVLRSAGYEVLEAEGASAALDLWRAHEDRVSLVVADMVLRDARGHELVARLRTDRADLRALFVTGYDPAPPTGGGRSTSLQKPFTPAQLVDAVALALSDADTAPITDR